MTVRFLQPIKESTEDYEAIERAIILLFKRAVYIPLLRELKQAPKTLQNSTPGLIESIRSGRITFNRGVFSGRLNSVISKDLQKLGARFDRKTGTYQIGLPSLPLDIRHAISSSESKFQEKIGKIDQKLSKILPEQIADQLKTAHLFDRSLWKVETDFQRSVRGITIAPRLTPEQSKRISQEWSKNMQLWIQDFTEKEILELRKNMQKSVFAGNRYESATKTIVDSYGVTERKARFLARQETSLLMTKFKQTRYQDAGVKHYKWGCVSGSKNHPVRPWHKALEGKVFTWDNPPVTTKPGEAVRRNNPGQDYNCRCFARPMVNYRE